MDTKTKECINKLFILRTSSFLCSSLIRRFEIDSISPSHKTTIPSFVSLICTWTQFVSTLTDSNLTLNQELIFIFLLPHKPTLFQRKLTKCGLSNQGVMMKVVTELQCQSLIIRILTIPMKLKLSNWKQWVNNDIANSNHTVQNFKSTKSHNTQSRISANAQWDVRLNADIEWHYPTHQQKKQPHFPSSINCRVPLCCC